MRHQPLRVPATVILTGWLVAPVAGIEVAGRVIEHRSGAPVSDARIAFRCLHGQQRSAAAIADESGRFHLRADFQGRCRMDVTKPGYASSVLFALIEGDLSLVSRMIKGGVISGRVMTEEGAPVPRASVVVLRSLFGASRVRGLSANNGPSTAIQSDGQGAYRSFGLPPGSYAVGVVSSMDAMPVGAGGQVRAATSPLRFLSITSGEEYTNVDFTLPTVAAGGIDGRVEGATADGAVLLALLPRDLPAAPLAKALMDHEGRFHFSGIPVGAYSLFAAGPSSGSGGYAGILGSNPVFAREELEVTPESSLEILVSMQPGKTVSFQLTGPDKTPGSACSPSGTLLLSSLEAWGAQPDRQAGISASAPLVLRDLAPSRYAATVIGLHEGCFSSSDTIVDLRGDVPPAISLQVCPGAKVQGKLVASETSGGGSRAVVLLWPNPGDFHDASFLALLPDASGYFTADSLQPGLYRLLAVREEDWSDPHWQPDFSAALEVQLLSGTNDVEIAIPARRPDRRGASAYVEPGLHHVPWRPHIPWESTTSFQFVPSDL